MTKPRKILFDANPLMTQLTGVGYYTAGLVRSLAQADPDVHLIGYYYNFLGRKHPPREPAAPQAPNISYRPIYHLPGPLANLLRRYKMPVPIELLTLTRADFILYPNFLGLPSLFATPNAPVIHDLMYHDHPEWGSDKNIRDLNRFVPGTLQRASFVITMSDFTTSRLADSYGLPAAKILTTFIPPVAATTIPGETAATIVAEKGITKPYMLFVATLEPRKNIVSLLDAYTRLPAALRDSHSLVLAGKLDWKYHETKEKLESLQSQGYDVKYLGYIDNDTRAALYQRARLMVLASHYEGFGMQLLEAMQYGVSSAVSDIPVFREVGGDMVDYFDHNDPDDIARVIAASLERPPRDPETLRSYVNAKPRWDDVAAAILARIRQSLS